MVIGDEEPHRPFVYNVFRGSMAQVTPRLAVSMDRIRDIFFGASAISHL